MEVRETTNVDRMTSLSFKLLLASTHPISCTHLFYSAVDRKAVCQCNKRFSNSSDAACEWRCQRFI